MNHIINKMLTDLEAGIDKKDLQYFYFGFDKSSVPGEDILIKGAVFVNPIGTDVTAITTGLRDKETNSIEIIVAKQTKMFNYSNAQSETGLAFSCRVIDGRDASGNLLPNTIRYIIRNNLRCYGILQPVIEIKYDVNRITTRACITSAIKISGVDVISQPIK